MLRALRELEVEGIHTTIPAHLALLAHDDFKAGHHSTKWVEDELDLAALMPTDADAAAAPADGDTEAPALVERTVPVEVNGKRFSVRMWLPDAPVVAASGGSTRARPRPAQTAGGGGAGNGTITAPMQGTIVKILVAEGDTVETGQAVLVLEAMKMENHINAETSGTVKEIRVAAGDTVGTGDTLVVIE
jgi:acetyl-CoA/propionyl-CoA carboxylase biotin carboxyl carrier protein